MFRDGTAATVALNRDSRAGHTPNDVRPSAELVQSAVCSERILNDTAVDILDEHAEETDREEFRRVE